MISADTGTKFLEQALQQKMTHAGLFSIDWEPFFQQSSGRNNWAFYAEIASKIHNKTPEPFVTEVKFIDQLIEIQKEKRKEVLQRHVQEQVAQVLGVSSIKRIKPQKKLFEMGLDSLMAVDLQKRLQASLDQTLSKTLVFDYPTVQVLTNYLAENILKLESETDSNQIIAAESMSSIKTEILELSDEEAEALLLAELNQLNS